MPITVTGNLAGALEAMGARVEAVALEGSAQLGHVLEASIKAQIKGGHPRRTKTGATPGGPPENITGTLRRSVITEHPRWAGAGRAETRVGPTTVYARAIELGHPRWKSGVRYPYTAPGVRQAEASGQLDAMAVSILQAAIFGA